MEEKKKKPKLGTIRKKMNEIIARKKILEKFIDYLQDEEMLKMSDISEEFEEVDYKEEEIETDEVIEEKLSTNTIITIKAVLKIACHALKYANAMIPPEDWVEVIGLLSGRLVDNDTILLIEDAYPMGHGDAIYAEIKDYKNYVRAWKEIREKKQDIVGWYHSHPSYSPFISEEDFGTQARYQKLWDRTVALVIDPFEIDGTRLGFEIFQADLETGEWFGLPFSILPEILNFVYSKTKFKDETKFENLET